MAGIVNITLIMGMLIWMLIIIYQCVYYDCSGGGDRESCANFISVFGMIVLRVGIGKVVSILSVYLV